VQAERYTSHRVCHHLDQDILFTDSKPFDPMPYVMLTGIPIPGRLWPHIGR